MYFYSISLCISFSASSSFWAFPEVLCHSCSAFFSLLLLYAQYRPLIVFQTLFVEPGLCLCDCPGLVMPSFVSTKAEMTCNGILPIDQMRDHVPPISLISFLLCKDWGFNFVLDIVFHLIYSRLIFENGKSKILTSDLPSFIQ